MISRIVDIPSPVSLSPLQTVQRRAINEGGCQVDRAAVVRFLAKLKYPVHFLDFETYQTAIPRLDGTRPYQQIPFQFSLYLRRAPGPSRAPGLVGRRGRGPQVGVSAESACGGGDGRVPSGLQRRVRGTRAS